MSVEPYGLVKRWNGRWYEWVETEPQACPNGHPWGKPGQMQRGHLACAEHHGHRTWRCSTCSVTVVNSPHDGAAEQGKTSG